MRNRTFSVPVGHADDENVVELFHPVYLAEELIDNCVVDPSSSVGTPSLFTDSIQLVHYYHVQTTVSKECFIVFRVILLHVKLAFQGTNKVDLHE